LHLGSYFLLSKLRPALSEIFADARQQGLTTSLDTNWDPLNQWDVGDLLNHTDLFLPNQVEAQQITKQPDLQGALDKLADIVPTLAIKMGAKGGLARQGQAVLQLPPPPVNIVDTVGAGDSFDAGFLYGYLNHWPLERSLRLALACGSLSTRAAGGTEAQPTLQEAEGWLEMGAG
jgi:sugar/nucleoside kinase (ribokinase family)